MGIKIKMNFQFGTIIFVIFACFWVGGEAQRSRLRGVATTPTPGSEVSSTSSSQASDAPLHRLRRPTRRTTTPFTTSTTTLGTTAKTTPQGQIQPNPTPNLINHSSSANSGAGFHRQINDDSLRQEMIEKLCNRKYGSSPPGSISTTTGATPILKKHTPTTRPSSTTTSTTPTTPSTTTVTVSQRGVKASNNGQITAYTSDNFSEPQRTVPRNPLLLRRSQAHVRVPRRVKKLTPRTTTTTTVATTSTATSTSTTEATPDFAQAASSPNLCTDFDHLTNEQLAKRVKGGLRRKHKPEN